MRARLAAQSTMPVIRAASRKVGVDRHAVGDEFLADDDDIGRVRAGR